MDDSHEEYAQHMVSKLKLALSIAVIKNKPIDLTVEEYVGKLKRNVEGKIIEDFDETICSDDFEMSVNHQKTIHDTVENDNLSVIINESETILNNFDIENVLPCHELQNCEVININDENRTYLDTNFDETLSILNEINAENDKKIKENSKAVLSQSTCESFQYSRHANNLDSYTETINIDKDTTPFNIYKADSITKGLISKENPVFPNIDKTNEVFIDNFDNTKSNIEVNELNINTKDCNYMNNIDKNKDMCNYQESNDILNIYESPKRKNQQDKGKECQNTQNNKINDTHYDSQATEIYNIPEMSNNYTHFSQSQCDNIIIDSNFITNNNCNNKRTKTIDNDFNNITTKESNVVKVSNYKDNDNTIIKDNTFIKHLNNKDITTTTKSSDVIIECINKKRKLNENDINKTTNNSNFINISNYKDNNTIINDNNFIKDLNDKDITTITESSDVNIEYMDCSNNIINEEKDNNPNFYNKKAYMKINDLTKPADNIQLEEKKLIKLNTIKNKKFSTDNRLFENKTFDRNTSHNNIEYMKRCNIGINEENTQLYTETNSNYNNNIEYKEIYDAEKDVSKSKDDDEDILILNEFINEVKTNTFRQNNNQKFKRLTRQDSLLNIPMEDSLFFTIDDTNQNNNETKNNTSKNSHIELSQSKTQVIYCGDYDFEEENTNKIVKIDGTYKNLVIDNRNKTKDVENTEKVAKNLEKIETNVSFSSEKDRDMVPFKIIEELNKIKGFLNRSSQRRNSEGYCSDSGYKSDSQVRSSQKNALLSIAWLNQSAYCLCDYIATCPFAAGSLDICEEISMILGQLIDKLHDLETYPEFLEQMFMKIDCLLDKVFRGQDCEETLLIQNENVERIFFLNSSKHIRKYTIGNIITKLDFIHKKLTSKEDLYELTNISEVENICYILHILYRLIKLKSLITENVESQEISQTKTTITDIWKRKWNQYYKAKENPKNEGSCEKVNVLNKCRVVLNKIIVECMDGYSLISFSALRCFNLLQS